MMREQEIAEVGLAGAVVERGPEPAGLGLVQIAVAHVYGVPLEALLAATRRDRRAAEARQVAMYLCHVVLRVRLSAVARGFGRDRSTVCHACRHIEELREEPARDHLLACLEDMVRSAAGVAGAGVQPGVQQ